jgi:hypothetical protein
VDDVIMNNSGIVEVMIIVIGNVVKVMVVVSGSIVVISECHGRN